MGVFIKNSDTIKAWAIEDLLLEGAGLPEEIAKPIEQGRITIVPGALILAVHNKQPLVGHQDDWLIQTSEKRFNVIKGDEFADKYSELRDVER